MGNLVFFYFLAFLINNYFGDNNQNQQVDVSKLGVRPNTSYHYRLQKIVDSVPEGTTLYFPAGEYISDTPMVVKTHNLHFKGAGVESTIFRFNIIQDWNAHFQRRVGMRNVGANGVSFEDITFDLNHRGSGKPDGVLGSICGICFGRKKNFVTGDPVDKVNVSNISVTNCKFYDWYADAVDNAYASSKNFTVSNNTFISTYIVQTGKLQAHAESRLSLL